jgi:hypothetical protein
MDEGLDYRELYNRIAEQLSELHDKRTDLENSLTEMKGEIAHLEEVQDHIRLLAGITYGEDIRGLGMTEAVRKLLRSATGPMTATEVRKELAAKGFDLSGLSSPMASIYKVLARIVDNSDDYERDKNDQGQVVYRWKQPEITDDDIPF